MTQFLLLVDWIKVRFLNKRVRPRRRRQGNFFEPREPERLDRRA